MKWVQYEHAHDGVCCVKDGSRRAVDMEIDNRVRSGLIRHEVFRLLIVEPSIYLLVVLIPRTSTIESVIIWQRSLHGSQAKLSPTSAPKT